MSTLLKHPFAFVSLLVLTASAPAATLSLSPVADAFVTGGVTGEGADPNAGQPNLNYGAAGALQISAAGEKEGEIQSLLQFNFASVKLTFDGQFGVGNWQVTGVTLQLGTNFGTQGTQPNNPIFNKINGGLFKIDWMENNNWGEGSGTPALPFSPANAPVDGVTFTSLGGLLSSSDRTLGTFTYTPVGNTNPPAIPAATYNLGLDPSFVGDMLSGGLVSLRGYAADTTVSYLFNSRSYPTQSNEPTLIIAAAAVPEPSIAVSGAIAVVLLLGRRRHRA